MVSISLSAGAGETIFLSVRDEGPGVPAEFRRRIFDPYFTTKNTGSTMRGLGLGLAICRKIAELHGGTIDIQESDGRGALFTAIFPVAGPRLPKEPESSQAMLVPHAQPARLAAIPQPA